MTLESIGRHHEHALEILVVPSPAVARSIMRWNVHWTRVHITGIPIAPIMDEPPVALPHCVPLKVLFLTGGVPADLVYRALESITPSATLRLSIVAGPNDSFRAKCSPSSRRAA